MSAEDRALLATELEISPTPKRDASTRWWKVARFELRHVVGNPLDIRCAHELEPNEAKALLDKRVRVTGRPEFARGGSRTIRMLWVDEVEELDD